MTATGTRQRFVSLIALVCLVPMLFVAARLSMRMFVHKDRRKGELRIYDSVFSEIIRHVFSPAPLFGKRMVVVAEKATESGP